MAEYVYVAPIKHDGDLQEVVPDNATLRLPATLWKKYQDAKARLAAVAAEVSVRGEAPLVVTPEQAPVMQAAARPGTWIVVRESEPVVPAAIPRPADAPEAAASEVPPAEAPAPPGPPPRPKLGRCEARSNLPHLAARYVITDTPSVYFPGRIRVDGICQCGLRIADVKCPHQKQILKGKKPACAWCGHILVARAGNIDNRNPDGSVNPHIPTLIPIGAAGDDPAVKSAFRVED